MSNRAKGRRRRKHSGEFKARVGLEALRGVKTISEIAKQYEVHPVQVSHWKQQMLEHLPEIFEKVPEYDAKRAEKVQERLHAKIGKLSCAVDFLKKKCRELNIPLDDDL